MYLPRQSKTVGVVGSSLKGGDRESEKSLENQRLLVGQRGESRRRGLWVKLSIIFFIEKHLFSNEIEMKTLI